MAYIAQNNVIPDIYSWHLLLTNRNLRESLGQFNVLRQQNNLPQRQIVINEYASWEVDEQSPAGGAFYISQLERHNIHGLRANWGSASKLHDLLANLLVKNATTGEYSTTGEWHVYDYYVREMTGQRVATTPSSDELFEVYATRFSTLNSVKVLAAVRPIAGLRTYDITITGLSAVGHTGNRVKIQTRRFDGPSVTTEINGSVDLGIYEHEVVDDKVRESFRPLGSRRSCINMAFQVTFWVRPDVRTNAYAFELVQ